jgi:hypothetical protein
LLFGLLIGPPLVVLVIALVRMRSIFATVTAQFGFAGRRLERAVAQAKNPAEVARIIRRFVARQCKLKAREVNAETVIGAIRVSGHRNLAIRCERLLNLCASESGALCVGDQHSLDHLKRETTQWLHDWQTESLRQRPKPKATKFNGPESTVATSSLRSSTAKIVAAIVIVGSMLVAGQRASAQAATTFDDKPQREVARVELSDLQQRTLLAEANKSYSAALEKVQIDSAEAKQGFADAADKYRLLVNGGVSNARLYFNLANAYLESGQTGRAVANYLRCLRIEPTMREAQMNLAYAKKALRSQASLAEVKGPESSVVSYAMLGNEWLNRWIGPRAVFVVTVGTWIAMWIFIGVRLL